MQSYRFAILFFSANAPQTDNITDTTVSEKSTENKLIETTNAETNGNKTNNKSDDIEADSDDLEILPDDSEISNKKIQLMIKLTARMMKKIINHQLLLKMIRIIRLYHLLKIINKTIYLIVKRKKLLKVIA